MRGADRHQRGGVCHLARRLQDGAGPTRVLAASRAGARPGGRQPVTCAAVLHVDGHRYVAWVATRPTHQRRGLADAAMRHALALARTERDGGPTVLHATEAGKPVYERMGYRTVAPTRCFSRSGSSRATDRPFEPAWPTIFLALGDSRRYVATLASDRRILPVTVWPRAAAFLLRQALRRSESRARWLWICWSSARIPTTSKSALAARSRGRRRQATQVGLCDLTAGELGSNGTPDERRAKREAAAGPRRRLAREPGLAGWRYHAADHIPPAVEVIRRHRPRTVAMPYWDDRHPDHGAASHVLQEAVFRSGLRRYAAAGEAWRPDWICYYFINQSTHAVLCRRRVGALSDRSARHWPATRTQFAPAAADAVADAAHGVVVPAAHRKPRRAVRRPDRRAVCRGDRRARTSRARPPSPERSRENRHRLLRHRRRQWRGRDRTGARARLPRPRHPSDQRGAPLPLALGHARPVVRTRRHAELSAVPRTPVPAGATNTLVRVSRQHKLDIIHAHYAVPARDGRVSGAPDSVG